MNTSEDTFTYVYAAARLDPHLRDAMTDLRGIHGAPVLYVTTATETGPDDTPPPLAFATSHVPAADFNESALKHHFEDLEWLENVARAHHDVVQKLTAHTTVLPLRMATVYQDDDRARQALTEQHTTLAERLTQLTAHTEFGVKIYLAPTTPPTDPDPDPAIDAGTASTPGKAYLQRRKAQHNALEATYGQAQQAAATIEAIASRYASQRVRHPAQRGALAGSAENVLNDAYLVPNEYAQRFKADLEEAAAAIDGVRVDVTGPWAPYSFAMSPRQDPAPNPAEGRSS
ncbi:GvpL/GvpF family gas vesicle protein [Streptomyces sp. ISL-66]|uniref:GvpL/GvpF family gas vesicle protein n=1 Tax=Streptomyces sp. ISL-66 TaxID=2819186 RepID=UPI001BE8A6AA|nr:GvpL/GvpF family gas vesicle protein [Streptomyces sp. ISL-66]MBT2471803.1 GvpL/GvpF family gas vesicle protein [Streptomyces sp. ISL-66]